MAKNANQPGRASLVKVECRHSVIHEGRTHRPGALLEVPRAVAEELEEGGFVEPVFDVVVPQASAAADGEDQTLPGPQAGTDNPE